MVARRYLRKNESIVRTSLICAHTEVTSVRCDRRTFGTEGGSRTLEATGVRSSVTPDFLPHERVFAMTTPAERKSPSRFRNTEP